MFWRPFIKLVIVLALPLAGGLAHGELIWDNANAEQKARLDSFYHSLNRHQQQRLKSMNPNKRAKIQKHISNLGQTERQALVSKYKRPSFATQLNNSKALKQDSMQAISIAQPGMTQLPGLKNIRSNDTPDALTPDIIPRYKDAYHAQAKVRQLDAPLLPELIDLPGQNPQFSLPEIPALVTTPASPGIPTITEVVPRVLSIPGQILSPEQRAQTIDSILNPIQIIRDQVKQDFTDMMGGKH